mmetsp:Transcript_15366/g.33778  ORF Transcript_15366/g.33778 Transcript_15366/m.33778 type:complete len:88 (-) Transcript_15366:95-358(-)
MDEYDAVAYGRGEGVALDRLANHGLGAQGCLRPATPDRQLEVLWSVGAPKMPGLFPVSGAPSRCSSTANTVTVAALLMDHGGSGGFN